MLFWCDKTLNFVPNFSLANCRRVSPDERCSRHAQVCISELEEVVRKHLEFDSILQHGFQCTSTRMWDCGVCFCLENPIDLKIQTRLGSLKLLVNCVDWDLGWKDVDLLRFAGLKTVFLGLHFRRKTIWIRISSEISFLGISRWGAWRAHAGREADLGHSKRRSLQMAPKSWRMAGLAARCFSENPKLGEIVEEDAMQDSCLKLIQFAICLFQNLDATYLKSL